MSRKSRERKERNKAVRPDNYFCDGTFEIARFGKNTIVRNNRTPEQQDAQTEYLCTEYPSKYKSISQKVLAVKEKVLQCAPYSLLMHLRSMAAMMQINIFSEMEYSTHANAILRAQEYVQSIYISAEPQGTPSMSDEDEAALHDQIVVDFEELYKEIQFFYYYWAAHTQKAMGIHNDRLREIVEAQYMYWVRGNRYQIFELEPLKSLLPPHDDVLRGLFGVSATEIISGLEKLRYSLSQGYADAFMDLGNEYELFRKAVDAGEGPEKVLKDAEKCTTQIIGKVFGSDLINVKAVTAWDDRFIELLSSEINAYPAFWDGSEFAGWPIVELPVIRKPFIKINGTAYAFLYYALFDNIYRNIQKGILRRNPAYIDQWKEHQTHASEEMVKDIFLKLLTGAEAHIGNYYPVKSSKKQMNENDIIIVYQNYLFIIEVKAGSFPSTPPITDFTAHIDAYHKLAEVADSQCNRTLEYIMSHPLAQFYDHEKKATFQLPQFDFFDDVFTFSVTVDNFNAFAAKAEKLSAISIKGETIVISYDDLLVYSGYFDSPIYFLHYLKQRKAAMRVPQYQMNDESDHLGLYIDRNLYAMNPSQYNDIQTVFCQGFRQKIDEYFNWLYVEPSKAQKPTQNIPKDISDIVKYLHQNLSPEKIRFAHYLLDLASDAKDDFAEQIRYGLRRQKELNYAVPIMAFGDVKYCAFITLPGVTPYTIQEQLDYVYAAASRNEAIPVMWILLEYDIKSKLVAAQGKKCFFSDLEGEDIERIKNMGREKAKDWVELYRRSHKKLGRNDDCPCGSGKKYKFCCINNN